MILTCPNCVSKFKLEAALLAPQGKRVRCSTCDEEWFQLPDPDELADVSPEAIPEETKIAPHDDIDENIDEDILEFKDVPEAIKPEREDTFANILSNQPDAQEEAEKPKASKKAKLAGYLSAALIGIGILATLIATKSTMLAKYPYTAALYQMLRMDVTAPGEGLVFDRVTANVMGENEILIEGFVINMMNKDQAVPTMEISFHKQNGDLIKSTIMPPPPQALAGEATLPFKTQYKGDTKNADHAKLRFVLGDTTHEEVVAPIKHEEHTHEEHH